MDSKVDIDIQYAPNGRMTETDKATLSDLVDCMSELGLTTDHHTLFRRSRDNLIVIGMVIGNIYALLKLFGVPDYFKTRMTERAKYDAALANKKREKETSEIANTPIVRQLSNLRNENISISIELAVPSPFSHSGGLAIDGKSSEEIASQLEGFIFHSQALVDLVNSEILPSAILGGVYIRLLPNGDLEVTWMLRGDGRKVTKVLRRSSSLD